MEISFEPEPLVSLLQLVSITNEKGCFPARTDFQVSSIGCSLRCRKQLRSHWTLIKFTWNISMTYLAGYLFLTFLSGSFSVIQRGLGIVAHGSFSLS